MSQRLSLSTIAAVTALGLASPAMAQQRSAVSAADLDYAAATSPAAAGDELRQLLSTDHVQKLAATLGVSATELSARVAALDDATLARLAHQGGLDEPALAELALDEPALAGGADTVVVSTTAIIIALLVLILLVN
jgi:hypothetical protein